MKLNHFVTEYDDSLYGDSFIDPLGVLVIWSAYGEQIFRKRVNSISNDVRNYTLNLLNHRLIRDLIDDESVVVSVALRNEIGDKKSLTFKQAWLIYLENAFTYSMISGSSSRDLDLSGVLGSTNGRRRIDNDPVLILSHKKQAHLLVRQLSLGISGRYKTPFMEIGFFDNQYQYHDPQATQLWEKTDVLFGRDNPLGKLYSELKEHLISLINTSNLKSAMPASCKFSNFPKKIVQTYQKVLATSGHAGEATRAFWLDVTGLDKGAAGMLLTVLDEQADSAENEEAKTREIFQQAKQRCVAVNEVEEAHKLDHILTLEPFLAELDLLFTLAQHRRNQTVEELNELWRGMGRDENTLQKTAELVRGNVKLQEVVKGSAKFRLNRLLSVATLGTFEEQLTDLLAYHAGVMKIRGQLPWVERSGLKQVRLNARTKPLPNPRALGTWVNNYYFPQFRNLVNGFRGVVA